MSSVVVTWNLAGRVFEKIKQREEEIEQVSAGLGIDQVYNLGFPTTCLDAFPMSEVIQKFSKVFRDFEPEEVLIPHRGDVHTDHRIVFDAASACCKWFRYPSVRRVLTYETLSETEFGLDPNAKFSPNIFLNISDFLNESWNFSTSMKANLGISPSREVKILHLCSGSIIMEVRVDLRRRKLLNYYMKRI